MMSTKIIKVYGQLETQVGRYVAQAKQIGLSTDENVEDKINELLAKIEELKKQVDELIAGGGITPEPAVTDSLMLSDGSYLKLSDGSFLKINA